MELDRGERAKKILSAFLIDDAVKSALKIQAAKERKDMSVIVEDLLKKYLQEHGDGNPAYSLEHWQAKADFKVTPAFFETNQKWDAYLKQCSRKELEQVEGKAIHIRGQARKYWLEKRGNEL